MLVTLDFVLSSLISFLKGWSKCASGQTATSTGLFHSKKHLIGGSLVLVIFFLFHLSTALSGQLSLYDWCKRPNANSL